MSCTYQNSSINGREDRGQIRGLMGGGGKSHAQAIRGRDAGDHYAVAI